MNTLVGLGALSSFAVSSLAALLPKLVSHISYPYKVLVSSGIQWLSFFSNGKAKWVTH